MSTALSNSVAYSFSQEKRELSAGRKDSPSPDRYNIESGMKIVKDKSPEWTISRTNRGGLQGDDKPGPGTYDADLQKLRPSTSYTIGTKHHDNSFHRESQKPGPGQYDPTTLHKPPAFTFGNKQKDQKFPQTPGPGAYERTSQPFSQKSTGDTKLTPKKGQKGSHKKYQSQIQSPGPGQYSPRQDPTKPKNPVYGFGKSSNYVTSRDIYQSPGPGQYNKAKDFGSDAKKVTIGGKQKNSKIQDVPGPGQYDYNQKTISQEIAKSQRGTSGMKNKGERISSLSREQIDRPGPGQYDPKQEVIKDRIPVFGFGNSTNRSDLVGKEEILKPGPGQYEPQSTKKGPSIKIGARIQEAQKDLGPGPGKYDPNPNATKDKVRAYKMGQKPSKTFVPSKSQRTIGPGEYHKDEDFCRNAQKVSIKGRPKEEIRNDSPGPGGYEPNDCLSKERIRSAHIDGGGPRFNNFVSDGPDPGQYHNSNQDFGRNAQKVSIMGKSRERPTSGSPGPGHYEPNSNVIKDTIKSVQMGNGKRTDIASSNAKDMPAPGQYDNNYKKFASDAPSFQIRGKGNDLKQDEKPGPGNYEPSQSQVKDKVISYNMGKSTSRPDFLSKERLLSPGPGQYDNNHKKFGSDAKSFSIRGRGNESKKDDKPGPGNYEPQMSYVKDKVITYKMGMSPTRPDMVSREQQDLPGPGNYNSFSGIGKDGPKYTLGQRSKSRQEMSPGPGQYEPNPNAVKDSLRNVTMGNGQRSQITSPTNKPGPGQYDNNHKKFGTDAQSFKIKGGRSEMKVSSNPGPGNYNPSDSVVKSKIISYNMGSATTRQDLVSKEQMSNPGPGVYYSPTKITGPKYTMGGRSKSRQEFSPGPGQYEANPSVIKDSIRNVTMGNGQRSFIVQQSDLPGPGQYDSNHKKFGSDATSFKIKSGRKEMKKDELPGPGNYDPSHSAVKDKVITYKMSSSPTRPDMVSNEQRDQPGPGNYYQETKIGGPKYTMGGRKQSREEFSPGPGQYQPNPNAVKDSLRNVTMGNGQRSQIVSSSQMPGPGQYDNNHKKFGSDAKSFKINSKREEKKRDESPGPGNYDPSHSAIKDKVITYKMSSSPTRPDMVSNDKKDQPGPGNYYQETKISGPKYTMGGRKQSREEFSPGPGQYEPNPNAVKDSLRNVTMGNGQRSQIASSNQLPGPGQYDSNHKKFGSDAKSFTINSRREEAKRDELPGPGNYDPSHSAIKDKVITYKMSSSPTRPDMVSKEQMDLPGPGNYHSPNKIGGPQYTMGGRSKSREEFSPGPGQYDPSQQVVKDRIPSANMGAGVRNSLVNKSISELPGPGQYDNTHKKFGTDAQSVSIRGRPEDKVVNNAPGPGNYDPKDFLTKDRVQTSKISQTKRPDLVSKEATSLPGPGIYTNQKEFGADAQAVSIRGRPKERVMEDKPGPGNYDPNNSPNKDRVVAYKIGQSSRTDIVSKDTRNLPGPGTYTQNKQFGQDATSFTMSPKREQSPKDLGPGPGQYDPSIYLTKPKNGSVRIQSPNGKKSGREIIDYERASLPGPGNYDQPSTIGKGPHVTINGRPNSGKVNDLPGPGTYDGDIKAVKGNNPSYKMSTLKRDYINGSQDLSKPGPGQYDAKLNSTSPSFTIGTKPKDMSGSDIPGPGTYQPAVDATKTRIPGVDFGKSPDRTRNSSPHSNDGGPGQYDPRDYSPDKFSSISYTIPKAEKKEPVDNLPGPGHYKIPCRIADVPKYSLPNQNEEFKWV